MTSPWDSWHSWARVKARTSAPLVLPVLYTAATHCRSSPAGSGKTSRHWGHAVTPPTSPLQAARARARDVALVAGSTGNRRSRLKSPRAGVSMGVRVRSETSQAGGRRTSRAYMVAPRRRSEAAIPSPSSSGQCRCRSGVSAPADTRHVPLTTLGLVGRDQTLISSSRPLNTPTSAVTLTPGGGCPNDSTPPGRNKPWGTRTDLKVTTPSESVT